MFSAEGLDLLLPVFVVIAIAIELSEGGPAFYRKLRMGRGSRPFDMHKFRTMGPGAGRLGAGNTAAMDARLTALGRLPPRYKLEELPPLWDVLRGEMPLVGPRPEIPDYVEHFREMYEPSFSVRPGMTGPAAPEFSNEEEVLSGTQFQKPYEQEVLPRKLSLSLEYFRGRSWSSDLGIILRTLTKMFAAGLARSFDQQFFARAADTAKSMRRLDQ